MTEFQELAKDAPKFASMERGELVAYAYGMHAAGTKTDAENAKLRELVRDMWLQLLNAYDRKEVDEFASRMRELSMEVVR